MPFTYLCAHKPYNVLCAFTDPAGRPTLADFVPVPGVYPAGRLDFDSEGLVILTDDGRLIQRITDPRFEHPKTYWVEVEGVVTAEALAHLQAGVMLTERGQSWRTRPAQARVIAPPALPARATRDYHPKTWLEVVLHEGKKRQLRRMTAAVGYPCLRLVRAAVGAVQLGSLPPGAWRALTGQDVAALRG